MKAEITKQQKEVLDIALNGRTANSLLNHFFSHCVLPIEKQDSDTKLLLSVGFTAELLAKCLYDSAGYDIIEEDETIVITAKMKEKISEVFKESEESDYENSDYSEGFDDGAKFILKTINLKIKGAND